MIMSRVIGLKPKKFFLIEKTFETEPLLVCFRLTEVLGKSKSDSTNHESILGDCSLYRV